MQRLNLPDMLYHFNSVIVGEFCYRWNLPIYYWGNKGTTIYGKVWHTYIHWVGVVLHISYGCNNNNFIDSVCYKMLDCEEENRCHPKKNLLCCPRPVCLEEIRGKETTDPIKTSSHHSTGSLERKK